MAALASTGIPTGWATNPSELDPEKLNQQEHNTDVLVIGGAPAGIVRWDEEQLRSRIQNLQAAGLGAKAISQQLAGDSGWPRREIYGLAVQLAQRGKADAN